LLARTLEDRGELLPLAYVASAGAPLDATTVRLVRAAFPGATLFNQYGLTEASPRVTAISDAEQAFARGSVGRPLDGVEVFAVDEAGRPMPPSLEGEIVVRGPNVMLGYLDDAEGTAAVLDATGALRTRDRGYVDHDGYVFVTGRTDGVVKVSGERVSVEEVAAVLRAVDGIEEAAVVALPHPDLGATLVAFVEGGEAARTSARDAARRLLPPAKRPSKILVVDALPRTQNGKIAYAELRVLASEDARARQR
jgi:acyl-CoA synthetase (AMP-forming)/AMP-acid ligase II